MNECGFLPRDSMQRVVMRLHVVGPSVTLKYVFHICWTTSKISSRLNGLRSMHLLIPTWAIWCNGNTPEIRVE